MLEWVENDDDHVQALMNAYRMGVCTVAAWKLHALSEPEGVVQAWLEQNTFTGGPGWVSNRMKFLSNPGRAVLIWSYWHGEPNVARVWCGLSTRILLSPRSVSNGNAERMQLHSVFHFGLRTVQGECCTH